MVEKLANDAPLGAPPPIQAGSVDGDRVSAGRVAWLRMLVSDYGIELANQAIQSPSACFESADDALLSMVREAYEKGAADAWPTPPRDFDADVAAVTETNARERRRREDGRAS